MFYVVYLIDIDEFIVIPMEWLRDNDIYHERFVNYSLNNAQTHLCYWTSKFDAITRNGEPSPEFPPNFNAEMRNSFSFDEGCYKCRVVRCKSRYMFRLNRSENKRFNYASFIYPHENFLLLIFLENYDDAVNYCVNRRERCPPLYYSGRLLERPIPNMIPNDEVNTIPAENGSIENEDMEMIHHEDYEEQEVMIPKNQLNPVVVLDRLLVENHVFDADYEVYADVSDHSEAENDLDEFAGSFDEMIGNEQPVIKYEITLQQDASDEVDGIFNDIYMNEPVLDAQDGGEMDNDINQGEPIDCMAPEHEMEFKVEANEDVSNAQLESGSDDDTANEVAKCKVKRKTILSSSGLWHIKANAPKLEIESDVGTTNEIAKLEMDHEALPSSVLQEANGAENDVSQSEPASAICNEIDDQEVGSTSIVWTRAIVGDDDSDDDVYYLEPEKAWPAAKTFEIAGYVKREKDRFSGDLPFSQKVRMQFSCFDL